MAKSKSKQNFNELMQSLESHRNTTTIDLHTPSLNSSAKFRQLTVNQQSQILTGSLSQEINQNVFSYNRVISQIILDTPADQMNLNLIDKIPLTLQLRVDTIGDVIDIDGVEYDLNTHVQQTHDKVTDVVDYALQEHTHTTDTGITLTYSSPTLQLDVDINTIAEKKWVEMDAENIISELFKVEMMKYIKTISFPDAEIDFSQLNFDQRMKICNILPMSCSKCIVDFIEKVKRIETEYTSISGAQIPIDATLFGT